MFVKAQRKRAKARIGLVGPSGAGKTYSALNLAFGLAPEGRVALVDTEHGSGSLYADLGAYDVLELAAPFTTESYLQAIAAAQDSGYDCLIIDSLSHAWAGPGGLLEYVDNLSASKNKYTAWRDATPRHNALVEAMLRSPLHIIATMRAKTEYVLSEQGGRPVAKKVGMAPVQREGMDYEFTLVFDLEGEKHLAAVSKDRTSLFDGFCGQLTREHGRQLRAWLDAGVEDEPASHPAQSCPADQTPPGLPEQSGPKGAQPHPPNPPPKEFEAILSALASRNIATRVDDATRTIYARSYQEKSFLKTLGFHWDSGARSWILEAV